MNNQCIFCQIVTGAAPAHKVWEDDDFLAFLSIFPNTDGVTVVIPKQHHPSYAYDLPNNVYTGLFDAARTVARQLEATFDDGRVGLVLEGFGIDHAHIKLFPLHGTKLASWQPIHSAIKDFYDQYPGFISSHDGELADPKHLAELAEKIRQHKA